MRGSGELFYASEVPLLNEEQEQVILDYMNLYFSSLEDLEPQEEIASLFSDEEQAALADSAIDFQIGLRQMQDADYTLASWSYSLTLSEITQEEDGNVASAKVEFAEQPSERIAKSQSKGRGGDPV